MTNSSVAWWDGDLVVIAVVLLGKGLNTGVRVMGNKILPFRGRCWFCLGCWQPTLHHSIHSVYITGTKVNRRDQTPNFCCRRQVCSCYATWVYNCLYTNSAHTAANIWHFLTLWLKGDGDTVTAMYWWTKRYHRCQHQSCCNQLHHTCFWPGHITSSCPSLTVEFTLRVDETTSAWHSEVSVNQTF